jgi:imidazolonepropionase-like amidohydrolase
VVAAQFTVPPPPAAYALTGVTVVQADGRQISDVNIVIRGAFLEAMGADVEIPPGTKVLEGDSLLVYPGLIDAQGGVDFEFPETEDGDEVLSWDPPRSRQGFQPHRRVAEHLTVNGDDLTEHRNNGIVAAAVHPSNALMPGRGTAVLLRKNAAGADLVLDPDLGVVMAFRGGQGAYPSTLMGIIAFMRQSFEDARRHGLQIEAYSRDPRGLTTPAWDTDYAVLREVMAGDVPVFFEADLARDIHRVLGLAEEYGFRSIIVGGDEAWKLADELRDREVPVLVSMDFPRPLRWSPAEAEEDSSVQREEPSLDPEALREKERLEDLYANAARLAEAGVAFALTSGARDNLLEGVRKAIEYGLSEEAALHAVTTTPAELLGLSHLPRIEQGMAATFIVTSGPLFEEETRVVYTFVEGALEEGAPVGGGGGEAPLVDLSGSWEMTTESQQGTFTSMVTLRQSGTSFSGTSQADFGTGKIQNGIVSGNNVSFTLVLQFGGQSVEMEFSGSAEAGSASGTAVGFGGSTMNWKARKVSGPGEGNSR